MTIEHTSHPRTSKRSMSVGSRPVDAFTVPVSVLIRQCRASDLPTLEWFGLFAPHRDIIRDTFDAQLRGDSMMLVAEINREPAGQLWVDLTRRHVDRTGVLWALRVLPCLQNLGIGTRLFMAAEQILLGGGFLRAELSLEASNTRARRLYERLGYTMVQIRQTASGPVTNDPVPIAVPPNQWLMRKGLA